MKKLVDWPRRVRRASRRKPKRFSNDDVEDAGNFMHCALGEARELNPGIVLYVWGPLGAPEQPYDATLFRLCMLFYNAVQDNYIKGAQRLIDEIEARVLELEKLRPACGKEAAESRTV